MDILREVMKRLLISAIKEKEEARRDALRLVIADVESDHKRQDDNKWAETVIRKNLKQNEEALAFYKEGDEGYNRLKEQSSMLQSFLPVTLSEGQIELRLREIECELVDCDNDGKAIGMAVSFFKKNGNSVLGKDVKAVVDRLRG